MFFYDKNTGEIRSGIAVNGIGEKDEITLKTRYCVDVFYEDANEGVKLVGNQIFWDRPTDNDIICLLLRASGGKDPYDYYAVVKEEKYAVIRYYCPQ